jgi:serine/threonine protein kinase
MAQESCPSRYEIRELIGEGGMGRVYRAFDSVLSRDVAIKFLSCESLEADSRERFLQEARALAALDHANIVRIFGSGFNDEGVPYHVMEFCNGDSLAKELAAGPLKARSFFQVLGNVLAGLEHAHKNNIAHRDLKPSNIIYSSGDEGNGVYKIIDFGIARQTGAQTSGATLTASNMPVGSPAYMSPEQCRGERGNALSDIYAMGCVMYECISGSPPFYSETAYDTMYRHMNQEIPVLAAPNSSEPSRRLSALVVACLAKKPADRPQSAAGLSCQLSDIFSAGAEKLDLFSRRPAPRTKLKFSAASLCAWVISGSLLACVAYFGISLPARRPASDSVISLSGAEKDRQAIERLKAKPEKNLRELFELGRLELRSDRQGDCADAEKTYDEALSLCRAHSSLAAGQAGCLALKAKAEFRQDKFEAADRDFNQAIALSKTRDIEVFHDILIERAVFLIRTRRFREALSDLRTVSDSFNFSTRTTLAQVMDNLDGISQKLDRGGESRTAMLYKIDNEFRKMTPRNDSEAADMKKLGELLAWVKHQTELAPRKFGS